MINIDFIRDNWRSPQKIGFNFIKQIRLGGFYDTAGILTYASSFYMSLPFFADGFAAPLSLTASFAGSYVATRRIAGAIINESAFKSDLRIKSSPLPVLPPGDLGFTLGIVADTNQPLIVPTDDIVRHIATAGQSGTGKTVFLEFLMAQQMSRGGGLIFIDAKLDSSAREKFYQMCVYYGRGHDFEVINPGDETMSNTYNPIGEGDPDEIADRIVSLIPSTESDAGADHFKQAAKQGCTVLVASFKALGKKYTFMDLVILLSSPSELTHLEAEMAPQKNRSAEWSARLEEARTQLSIFLEPYKVPGKDGVGSFIDTKKLKDVFGGIGGRLFTFGTGSFGKVMNHTLPEVNLYNSIRANKLIYVMLPTMGKSQTASNFGKMFLGDLRTAISWIQALPEAEKPNPPTLAVMDELGSYSTEILSRPFEQGRSARIILAPAYQTNSNLDAVSEEFTQMVQGNTWIKVHFKIGSHKTAEELAEAIGMEMQVQDSISVSGGVGASNTASGGMADQGMSDNESLGYSERAMEGYKVSPDNLKSLNKGEAIITVGGKDVYHVRIPMFEFSPSFIARHKKVILNHPLQRTLPKGSVAGLFNKKQKELKKATSQND
jgi:2-phospho-L-lactate guanylyltransferase (CobY/MobA/RfbA family)